MEQIILDGSQRGLENGKWRTYTDIMPSITAREYKEPRSVMEVIQIGNIAEEKNFRNPQTGRIYDVRGCSPTLSTMQGGNLEPKILEEQIPCKLNKVSEGNFVGLDNAKIRKATKGGSTECEIGGCEVVRIEKVGQISSNGSQCGTVISDNGISTNLVAGTHGYANSHIATQYRIRKLTPRECGRLMGVADEDITKMEKVNSNSQLYKQFGNSIVVDVLCAIFKQLNIEQEKEKK